MKTKMVPKLRFPEFREKWQEKRLVDLFLEFKSGFGITSKEIQETGKYPVYGGNGIRGYSNEYTHDGSYFLIGRQGALCGNINRVEGKSYISEHAIACKANESSYTEWLAQRLDFFNLNRLSESSAQPGLSVKKLLRVKLVIPNKEEQQKIANFLTAIDTKIQQLTEKKALLEAYKKGVMQRIFKQEIRFLDEEGKAFPEWEKVKLAEVAERVTRKNKENNTNVLTISAQHGLINQQDFFNKSVSAKNVTGYYLLNKDEFAYNKSYSKGYPMGAIKRLNRYKKGVLSTLYICFKIKENNSKGYFEQYFESGFFNKELHKIAQEGARNHGLLNMSVLEFFGSTKLPRPSLKEQNRIENFLSNLDDKIKEVNKQFEKLQSFKKGLLQKMFV